MDHVGSIRAALKAKAPVVAIPVEGRVPVCIRAKLLKGALKGVKIHSVQLLDNGWLKVTGMADGCVRTSCKFAPMERRVALEILSKWSDKEREKRIMIINQGVLSTQEQKAMKLAKAEKAGISEMIEAQTNEQRILATAKAHSNPVVEPVDSERRADVIQEYVAFRAQRGNRKRGSVIRWKLKKLREEKAGMLKNQGRRNRIVVLRRKRDAERFAAVEVEIASLEKQFESLYPPIWQANDYIGNGGYWVDSFIANRPKEQAYRVRGRSYWEDVDRYDIKAEARRLKEARADIRALTPPEDEIDEMSVAA